MRSYTLIIGMLIGISGVRSITGKIILWDLGHVLFEPSKIRIGHHIGFCKLLLYKLRDQKNLHDLRLIMFDIFDRTRSHEKKNTLIPDDEGKALCNVLCDYQAGLYTSEQILSELYKTIHQLDKEDYFSSPREKEIIQKTIQSVFDPQVFSQFMQPIMAGVDLLKECALKQSKHGTRYYEMMCISNWDRESYELLCTLPHGQLVFQYFKPENVIISGMFNSYVGLKPSKSIFEYIIKQKGLPAHEFVYIDDQVANIKAAKDCGMTTLRLNHKKGGYEKLRRQLKRHGIL